MAIVADNTKEVKYVCYDYDESTATKRHFRANAPRERYEFTENHPLGVTHPVDIAFFESDKRFKVFDTIKEAKKFSAPSPVKKPAKELTKEEIALTLEKAKEEKGKDLTKKEESSIISKIKNSFK